MKEKLEAIENFIEVADAAMEGDYHSAFFGLDQAFRQLVFESGEIAEAANRELKKIADDPSYLSMNDWDPHNLILANRKHWQLRIGLYTRSSELLYSLPYHMMVAVIGSTELVVDHYVLPGAVEKSVFEPSTKVDLIERRIHRPGDMFEVDSRKDIVDARIDVPVAAVKLNSSIHASQQWAFSRATGIAIQGIASNPLESDLVSIARALGAMGRECSVESVLALSSHSSHFVRWAAVQSLAKLAPEEAVAKLKKFAAEDSHPHLKKSAMQALRKIELQPAH